MENKDITAIEYCTEKKIDFPTLLDLLEFSFVDQIINPSDKMQFGLFKQLDSSLTNDSFWNWRKDKKGFYLDYQSVVWLKLFLTNKLVTRDEINSAFNAVKYMLKKGESDSDEYSLGVLLVDDNFLELMESSIGNPSKLRALKVKVRISSVLKWPFCYTLDEFRQEILNNVEVKNATECFFGFVLDEEESELPYSYSEIVNSIIYLINKEMFGYGTTGLLEIINSNTDEHSKLLKIRQQSNLNITNIKNWKNHEIEDDRWIESYGDRRGNSPDYEKKTMRALRNGEGDRMGF